MIPGPSAPTLYLLLLAFAAAMVMVGEAVRAGTRRWVPAWGDLGPLERGLLDFFLGGAVFYLIGVLPFGLFVPPVLVGVVVVATIALVVRAGRARPTRLEPPGGPTLASIVTPPVLLAVVSALGLLAFEVALATPVGTGNTYDSSLLTLYTARLLAGHQLPLSFLPYAPVGLLYPQGSTPWMATAQVFLGLPGARTSLLVTPLFLALAPIGGYVVGERLFDSPPAGAAFAVTLAGLASWTRVLVGGSNDFVLAFPLVLLLLAFSVRWLRGVPPWGEAVAFGLLLGYSATMNPVGAEWLLPALLVAILLARPAVLGAVRAGLARWGGALGAALVPLAPTWYVLAEGLHSPRFVPGGGAPGAAALNGISSAGFVGSIDPYLFRPTDVWLSPVPALRLELAALLTLGLAMLLVFPGTALAHYLGRFRRVLASAALVLFGLLGVEWLASTGWGPALILSYFLSTQELSIWLFVWYGFIAALPLVVVFEWLAARDVPSPTGVRPPALPARWRPRLGRARPAAVLVPMALALVILLPGVALTPAQLAPSITDLYASFGNVTADDFALLAYLGSHLPFGARLLVAPGSAAEFAPAYSDNVTLLYPMVPGFPTVNTSYTTLVRELTNDSLDAAGTSALGALDVQYIAATGRNTILWPPFGVGPFLNDSAAFPILFHQGDAYLFAYGP